MERWARGPWRGPGAPADHLFRPAQGSFAPSGQATALFATRLGAELAEGVEVPLRQGELLPQGCRDGRDALDGRIDSAGKRGVESPMSLFLRSLPPSMRKKGMAYRALSLPPYFCAALLFAVRAGAQGSSMVRPSRSRAPRRSSRPPMRKPRSTTGR